MATKHDLGEWCIYTCPHLIWSILWCISDHVKSKACYHHNHNIACVRCFTTRNACKTLAQGLITSSVDNYNALLYVLPDTMMTYHQIIQNYATQTATCTEKLQQITPVLSLLHWLQSYRVPSAISWFMLINTKWDCPSLCRRTFCSVSTNEIHKVSLNTIPKTVIYGNRYFH